MSNEIMGLNPKAIWKHFYSLTQIPRPSTFEDKIQDYMVNWGKGLGLETIKDETGNIIIRKPATPGMENRMGVVLQGHLDMVPQANSDTPHNFETDPITTYIDGDWVTAKGTTLGADNGMGVAASMAVLEANDLVHGPIEALFTCDEETGMTGAFGLQPGVLKGDILMNLDSEDEGELYVGCAGGEDVTSVFEYKQESVPAGHKAFKFSVTGLKGGHSGMDIVLGRANANKILFRFLKNSNRNQGVRIASIKGGSLRNAIPREAFAVITCPEANVAELKSYFDSLVATTKSEFAATEPDMTFGLVETDAPAFVIDADTTVRLINAVKGCPNGVMRMSDAMPGLVETSLNLAIVATSDKTIEVMCLMRSSVDSARKSLGSMVESVFTLAGATTTFSGAYPGWKPNMESPILKTMQDTYQKMYGKVPETKAIHAGLECGLLGGVYPNWDMISFGPTIRFPHSPDEKVFVPSVQKFWDFLVETLKNVPVK